MRMRSFAPLIRVGLDEKRRSQKSGRRSDRGKVSCRQAISEGTPNENEKGKRRKRKKKKKRKKKGRRSLHQTKSTQEQGEGAFF